MTDTAYNIQHATPPNSIEAVMAKLPSLIKVRAVHHRDQTMRARAAHKGKHQEAMALLDNKQALQTSRAHIEIAAQRAGVKPDPKTIAEIDAKFDAVNAQIAANAKADVQVGWFEEHEEYLRLHPSPAVAEVKERDEAASVLIEELNKKATPATNSAAEAVKIAKSLGRDTDFAIQEIVREVQRRAANEPRFAAIFYPDDFDRNGRFRIGQPGRIEWPRENLGLHLPNHNAAFADDAVSLLCWLFPDQLTLKLTELAKKVAPKNGVSAADKIAAVERAYVAFDRAVRREDAILFALEKRNIFMRKRRIHPAVALRIEVPSKTVAEYL